MALLKYYTLKYCIGQFQTSFCITASLVSSSQLKENRITCSLSLISRLSHVYILFSYLNICLNAKYLDWQEKVYVATIDTKYMFLLSMYSLKYEKPLYI